MTPKRIPLLHAIAAAALIGLLTTPARAADDPQAPVREVMRLQMSQVSASEARRREDEGPFAPSALARFYTRGFTSAYRAARAAIQEAEDPFETDPIDGGQDSCPYDKIGMTTAPPKSEPKAGRAVVSVRFQNRQCMSGTDAERATVTTTLFDVTREGGEWRIDDVRLDGKSFKQGLIDGAKRHGKTVGR